MRSSLGLAACLTLASSHALPSPLVTPSAPKSEVTVMALSNEGGQEHETNARQEHCVGKH
jgi:hypothetical protein